mmetsp:Transcript_14980/g.42054  ORF Transcript_14980/g.42054 Transcript_14980/m.42054 type:complete len:296 (-) Transcript_14980:563-1450(-)
MLPRVARSVLRCSAGVGTRTFEGAKQVSSLAPEQAVYSGPQSRSPGTTNLGSIRRMYESGEPIVMITAYDYPSAVHIEAAGAHIGLIGDSAAMVVHGHDTTLPITVDELLSHCRAVARGARKLFRLGDMPFGSYEGSQHQAISTAVRFMKEGQVDAVKLEGGSPARVAAASAIVDAGVAVMGHVGLSPQSISVLGTAMQASQGNAAGRAKGPAIGHLTCVGVLVEYRWLQTARQVSQRSNEGCGGGDCTTGSWMLWDCAGMRASCCGRSSDRGSGDTNHRDRSWARDQRAGAGVP